MSLSTELIMNLREEPLHILTWVDKELQIIDQIWGHFDFQIQCTL